MYIAQSAGAVQYTIHLGRGLRSPNDCPGYDTKQSAVEVPVMLQLLGKWSTPSLPYSQFYVGPEW